MEDIAPHAIICDRRDKVLNAFMERMTVSQTAPPLRYAPSTQLSSFADFLRRDNSLLIFTRPFLRTYAGKDAVILPYQHPGAGCGCAPFTAAATRSAQSWLGWPIG